MISVGQFWSYMLKMQLVIMPAGAKLKFVLGDNCNIWRPNFSNIDTNRWTEIAISRQGVAMSIYNFLC